jgi:hypothetical protein
VFNVLGFKARKDHCLKFDPKNDFEDVIKLKFDFESVERSNKFLYGQYVYDSVSKPMFEKLES